MQILQDERERYDELDNFLNTIAILKTECQSKDLKQELDYLLYEAGYDDEKQELEEKISKMEEQEERQMNYEFERSRL